MTSLLFVDDEDNVLSGLRRMLRRYRNQWEMDFACGGPEALDRLGAKRFDVVISDMRMPNIDGAALLAAVRERWPSTVRIVLSGQSEQERIFRAIGPAHQYLSKPCDADRLTQTVTKSCALRDRLANDELKQLVSQLDAVPSQPKSIGALADELTSPHATVERVGEVIATDVGMTAKVLQLVSSSFFGQAQRVASAQEAASLLGLELLRELVLSVGIFREFDTSAFETFSLSDLTQHSLDVAQCAQRIAELETSDRQLQGDTHLAGMLHDIGKVILATCLPDDYRRAITLAHEKRITLWQAEMEVFGASHAEVGSYLLGLWGIPDTITEAVCHYRTPKDCPHDGFRPLTTVHVANILRRKQHSSHEPEESLLYASEYLTASAFADRLSSWCDASRAISV